MEIAINEPNHDLLIKLSDISAYFHI